MKSLTKIREGNVWRAERYVITETLFFIEIVVCGQEIPHDKAKYHFIIFSLSFEVMVWGLMCCILL